MSFTIFPSFPVKLSMGLNFKHGLFSGESHAAHAVEQLRTENAAPLINVHTAAFLESKGGFASAEYFHDPEKKTKIRWSSPQYVSEQTCFFLQISSILSGSWVYLEPLFLFGDPVCKLYRPAILATASITVVPNCHGRLASLSANRSDQVTSSP